VVHITGLSAALMAVPVLVTLAAVWRGDVSAFMGVLIYGLCLIGMILCSALYHMLPTERWRSFLRGLDHSAIYFKIAGTYTPFTVLSGGHGAWLVSGLWGAALAGTGLQFLDRQRWKWIALGLYLVMGWAGLVGGGQIFSQVSEPVFVLIVIGGLLYSAGVVFFLLELMPFHNTIWHVFVLLATGVFYAAVLLHLSDTSVATALASVQQAG